MKSKDIKLFHSKSISELQADLEKARKELIEHRLALKTNKLKNTSLIKTTKQTISILKTIIHQHKSQKAAK